MKITEYPSITKLASDNVFIVDGDAGTKKITGIDLLLSAISLASPYNHRMLYRGKNLGNSVSEEQKAAIQNGTFDDLWLADYWEINGVKWRIADFDYWLNTGDSPFNKHHLVIIPDGKLYSGKMNESATTTGGYTGSSMRTSGLEQAKTTVTNAFGGSVLTHREYLIDTVSSGYPSSGDWTDSTVDLMTEEMVYGTDIYRPSGDGSKIVRKYGNSNLQLALFAAAPVHIINDASGGRMSYWLRDIASASTFVKVSEYGSAENASANGENGVRPVFAIG